MELFITSPPLHCIHGKNIFIILAKKWGVTINNMLICQYLLKIKKKKTSVTKYFDNFRLNIASECSSLLTQN